MLPRKAYAFGSIPLLNKVFIQNPHNVQVLQIETTKSFQGVHGLMSIQKKFIEMLNFRNSFNFCCKLHT